MSTKRIFRLVTLLLMILTVTIPLNTVASSDPIIDSSKGFRKAVTLAGIREHQAAFQAIANANGGNRLAGTQGYDDSAAYVMAKMQTAGYNVSTFEFTFQLVSERTPSELVQIAPTSTTYVNGVDFATMSYSGSGDVTAQVSTPANLGCNAIDFAGFPAGRIALISRGVCTFRTKATNAAAAGAPAVLVYNNRAELLNGTLGEPRFTHPVVGLTQALGQQLVALVPGGLTMRVKTDTIAEMRTTRNVIAETSGGDPNRVIVIGAHLDSVSRGPGINDNGSGSAAILEVAETFASQQRDTRNKLRFMWFSAEELGLIGSTRYVNSLTQAELDRIELNLNFDMIGSPNYVRFVYDGNNSAFPVGTGSAAGPAGSGAIEELFHSYFASQGLASAETPFSGRSDYGPFIAKGIPAGGLFTGAEGIKTPEQATIYGGTSGIAYDPCYHLACDTFATTNTAYALKGLDEMSDAVAHTILTFSKWKFDTLPLVDGPPTKGKGNGGEGGGLHDDHDDEPVTE